MSSLKRLDELSKHRKDLYHKSMTDKTSWNL